MEEARVTALAVALLFVLGCTNPGAEERQAASEAFKSRLVQETDEWAVSNPPPYKLTQVLDLAHARTLKLTEQNLNAELSRVARAAAFSVFLPSLELNMGRTVLSGKVQTHGWPYVGDATFTESQTYIGHQAMTLTQPLFTPSAWVMFAETHYGVRIEDIVKARAGELLDAQVAGLFMKAVVSERLVSTYEAQVASGRALTNRVSHLFEEGYVRASDQARAEARLANDEANLAAARDARETIRQKLCEIIRFWPLAGSKDAHLFDGESLLAVRSPVWNNLSEEECVWRGLLSRKDLYAGDQTIELRKAQVLEALASFLPNVVLGAGGANLSLYKLAARGWAGGIYGVWSVFSGFRTIQEYRAARLQREAEFQLQEDRMLGVVTAVAEAYRNRARCETDLAAAQAALKAATLDYEATNRRFEEGEETFSAVLDKQATLEAAEVQAAQREYSSALAEVVLRETIGVGLFEEVKP